MIPSQMLKGTLEGCILTVIGQGEVYGYEISQKLERYGFGKIAEGTIYPLLLRLEKNGCVSSFYRKSEVGPRRKYYTLTERGCNERDAFFSELRKIDSGSEPSAQRDRCRNPENAGLSDDGRCRRGRSRGIFQAERCEGKEE